jgi:hypothetical protein
MIPALIGGQDSYRIGKFCISQFFLKDLVLRDVLTSNRTVKQSVGTSGHERSDENAREIHNSTVCLFLQ